MKNYYEVHSCASQVGTLYSVVELGTGKEVAGPCLNVETANLLITALSALRHFGFYWVVERYFNEANRVYGTSQTVLGTGRTHKLTSTNTRR